MKAIFADSGFLNDQGGRIIGKEVKLDVGIIGHPPWTAGIVPQPDIVKFCRCIIGPAYPDFPVAGIDLNTGIAIRLAHSRPPVMARESPNLIENLAQIG